MKNQLRFLSATLILFLNACSTGPIIPFSDPEGSLTSVVPPHVVSRVTPPHVISPDVATLKVTNWNTLPGWRGDDIRSALDAFLQSCRVLRNQKLWMEPCELATSVQRDDNAILHKFFEHNFKPYQVLNSNGSSDGLITGYYEPLLKGSRKLSDRYRFPLYKVPKELLVVDLGNAHPKLKHLRLRGRLEGQKIVSYYSRAEIESDPSPLQGHELLWVEDAVELFFLQIQGSGRIEMDSGEIVRVGYHNQNGHPYQSIGKLLVKRGELPLAKASMQGIKAWGIRNPRKLNELLHQNPSYVFFSRTTCRYIGANWSTWSSLDWRKKPCN